MTAVAGASAFRIPIRDWALRYFMWVVGILSDPIEGIWLFAVLYG